MIQMYVLVYGTSELCAPVQLWYRYLKNYMARSRVPKKVTAVDGGNLAVRVLVDGEVQYGLRHVLILTRTTSGHLFLLPPALGALIALVLLIRLLRGHFAREHARRDRVHAHLNAWTRELLREERVQVVRGGLRDVVFEVVLRCTRDA